MTGKASKCCRMQRKNAQNKVMITMDLCTQLKSQTSFFSQVGSHLVLFNIHWINWANSYNSLTYRQDLAGIPWKSSGAAYGGLPQKVFSLLPIVNSLLKPKSASLMSLLRSISRFSACNIRSAITVQQQLHRYNLWRVAYRHLFIANYWLYLHFKDVTYNLP